MILILETNKNVILKKLFWRCPSPSCLLEFLGSSQKILSFSSSGIWGCSANAPKPLSEFQCLFEDSAPAHFRQEGHLGKRAVHFLPQCEAKPESWISPVHSKPIPAIPLGPGHQTHSTSDWSVQTPFQLNIPSHQGQTKWKKFTNIVLRWNLELFKLKWDKSGQ